MAKRPQYDRRGDRQRAIINKIVTNERSPGTYDRSGNRSLSQEKMPLMDYVSDQTAATISDVESMYQLLPDLELSSQILVSSILSPKDLSTPELRIRCDSLSISDAAAAKLIRVLTDYFVLDYKMNSKLTTLVTNALIKKGSVPRLIIPESSLDQIINDQGPVTMESVAPYYSSEKGGFHVSPIGLLGDTVNANTGTLESFFKDHSTMGYAPILTMESADHVPGNPNKKKRVEIITITDNPEVMRIPALLERLRRDRTNKVLKERYVTLESVKDKSDKNKEKEKDKENDYANMSDRDIEKKLEANRKHNTKSLLEVRTKHQVNRTTHGHPMDVELPPESVIPAYVPGTPHEHIGYFIALDNHGYPINSSVVDDHYRQLQHSFKRGSGNENSLSNVVRELRGTFSGGLGANSSPIESIMQATDMFADIVEKNLLQRVRSGTGNMAVSLSRPTHLYQIMLARTAARKGTQMLYVPAELMSYLAFYYNPNGIGRSILENTRILGGIRVLLMFSNAINHVRNATPRTELGIDLDPNDTDPYGTISMIRTAFLRSRSEGFPLGEGRPDAALNYLHRSGVDVVYNGHEDLPEMKIETRDANSNRPIFDDRIEDDYKERHIMAFGLSPETVDSAKRVDFATTIVNSSLLLSKRVLQYGVTFEENQADFIRKYTNNSETLLTSLLETAESFDENESQGMEPQDIIEQFLLDISVSLPKPDGASLRAKLEALEEYTRGVDDAIENFISDDMAIMDAEGDMGRNLREYRAAWKAMLVREYMEENDIFPELRNKLLRDEDGTPLFNFAAEHDEHMGAVLETMRDYIAKASRRREKRDAYLKIEDESIREEVKEYIAYLYGKQKADEVEVGGDDSKSDDNDDDTGGGDDAGGDSGDDTGGDDAGGDTGGDSGGDDLDDDLFSDNPADDDEEGDDTGGGDENTGGDDTGGGDEDTGGDDTGGGDEDTGGDDTGGGDEDTKEKPKKEDKDKGEEDVDEERDEEETAAVDDIDGVSGDGADKKKDDDKDEKDDKDDDKDEKDDKDDDKDDDK